MLTAYFDESGTHEGSKVLSFGGYISTTKKWRQFDKQWRKMLIAEQIPMMHWTDLECRHGVFKNWSEERRLRVQKQVISIMKDYILHGFSSSVVLADYKEVAEIAPRCTFSSAYSFAVISTLRIVKKWIEDNNIQEPINYIFESGAGSVGEIAEVLNEASHVNWEYYRMRSISSCSFAKKIEVLPLQSADILAYETYKQMLNGFVGDVRRPLRKSAESMLMAIPHNDQYFNKNTLLQLITHLGLD